MEGALEDGEDQNYAGWTMSQRGYVGPEPCSRPNSARFTPKATPIPIRLCSIEFPFIFNSIRFDSVFCGSVSGCRRVYVCVLCGQVWLTSSVCN